ncbi:hypothetical protein OsI_37714 [Oryza sativa Indica Group]|uniref:Uncharacterized protein n=1 Tax=Oryza sativa subsp. indica TaxID=39946 RepID=B8BNH8_ORYSI|nr:hypothetical protein OsI_37714 [Oryza sativa Indica Group]
MIFKDIVQMRDEQWWRALTSGYVTQWAAMHQQKVDALFYAHSLSEVHALALLLERFCTTPGCKAYLVVSGSGHYPCKEAAAVLKWPKVAVYSSMRGIIRMHNPSVIVAVANVDTKIKDAFRMAADSAINHIAFVLLPCNSIFKVLWMATLRPTSLPNWNRMRISGNIITQNRAKLLRRLLASLRNTYYVSDEVPISFNMDSRVDATTLNTVNSFDWPHGGKTLRRRIIQGGLIRAQRAGGQQLRPPRRLTPFSLSVRARRPYIISLVNWIKLPDGMNRVWLRIVDAHDRAFLDKSVDAVESHGEVTEHPYFAVPTGELHALRPQHRQLHAIAVGSHLQLPIILCADQHGSSRTA